MSEYHVEQHFIKNDLAEVELLDTRPEHLRAASPGDPAFLLILEAQLIEGATALLAKHAAWLDWLGDHDELEAT